MTWMIAIARYAAIDVIRRRPPDAAADGIEVPETGHDPERRVLMEDQLGRCLGRLRGEFYAGVLPDRVFIFREPILAICETYEDVVEEVHVTVVHEIAHHFGIDDNRLHELGYD